MTVSYRTGVNILQFIYFVPAGTLAIFLCFQQGLKSAASSWRFVVTLALLRIAGDIAYFVTLSYPSLGAYVTVIICDLMGLAPLTLTCAGLLERVNGVSKLMPPRFFTILGVTSLAGLVVGIVGAVLAVEDSVGISYSNNSEMQAALGLFIAVYTLTLYCFGIQTFHALCSPIMRSTLGREIYVIAAVGVSLPFLLVRMIYASIADYGNNPMFNFFDGNVTVYLCMGVLVEIIVTMICLAVGFLVPPPTVEKAIRKRTRSCRREREASTVHAA
ncbi:hypothetical protein N7451_008880 [Penicillium sp. IBT 35674x]|nr:hypothetical protein N7451_008880 [Penicillium sp. IBT 35674x]